MENYELVADLIYAMLENFIYDITDAGIKNCFDKVRRRRFLKSLDVEIVEFCKKNECKYLDSSAFEYFIRNERFLESVVERALAINVEKSNEDYLRDKIKIAKEIANLEDVAFSYNEERLIKDIYSFVTEKVSAFYCKKLTVEQRHSVNICLNELTELKKSVDRVREKSDANYNSIIEAISDGSKLSNFKASVIVDLLSKNLIEGRFQEFDKLASIVKDRSDDVECFYECLSSILRSENCKDSIQRMISINDTYIRDTAIKTAIPILIYRNESLDCLLDIPSTGTLRIIVSSLVTGAYEGIFTEDISIDSGIEFHNITLNKKLLCEEKYLVEHIVLMQLHDKSIKNVHLVMEELEQGSKTWISRILVFDKKLESFEKDFSNTSNLDELITQLQQYKNIYDGLCNTLRCFYYYVLVKAFLIAKKSNEAEKCIPSDLIIERPLSDLVLAIKIEKKEAKLEEIYEYIMQNDNTFWLLNNYFVSRKNEQELIVFCRVIHSQSAGLYSTGRLA